MWWIWSLPSPGNCNIKWQIIWKYCLDCVLTHVVTISTVWKPWWVVENDVGAHAQPCCNFWVMHNIRMKCQWACNILEIGSRPTVWKILLRAFLPVRMKTTYFHPFSNTNMNHRLDWIDNQHTGSSRKELWLSPHSGQHLSPTNCIKTCKCSSKMNSILALAFLRDYHAVYFYFALLAPEAVIFFALVQKLFMHLLHLFIFNCLSMFPKSTRWLMTLKWANIC